MKRRNLVLTAVAGTAAIVTQPRPAEAAEADAWSNVLFTGDNPGHWAAVTQLHIPVVEITGDKISVRTPHPMTEQHYIVSHTVVLADGTFVNRHTFNWQDEPTSEHTLPAGYRGGVTVTSTCNLHDWWIKKVTV